MLKENLCRVLSLFLCLTLFGGCGGDSAPQGNSDEDIIAAFEELLAADYEVYYLLFADGLPVDRAGERMLDGAPYYPVASQRFPDREALKKRLEEVYAKEETVEALLAAPDAKGTPVLTQRDGTLWRSAGYAVSALGYEVVEDSIRLTGRRSDLTATFSFQEEGLDGSLYETAMSISRTGAGWRLDAPRKDAERKLLREGSSQTSAYKEGTARRVAEDFLAAIHTGSAAQGAAVASGDCTAWEGVRITEARITGVTEELDSQGDYKVQVTVEDGKGFLPEGSQEYRLVVRCGQDMSWEAGQVIPFYFRPASERYYNWAGLETQSSPENEAANSIEVFISLYGMQTFASPWELPPETVAEFSMVMVKPQGEDMVYTPQEFAAAVERCFGITGFDGRNTEFYSQEKEGYLLWGRGPNSPYVLIGMPQTAGNSCQTEVSFYGDPLCTQRLHTLRYTMGKNPDGSWHFVSAQEIQTTE